MTTYLPTRPEGVEDRPRKLNRRSTGVDRVFAWSATAVGTVVLLITGGIGLFLLYSGFPTLQRYGWRFFTETEWNPEQDTIGIAAVLGGTVSVALVALVIAFPLAFLTALFISDYAPARIKGLCISAVDLMAAVPSLIYGIWGFWLLRPHVGEVAMWLHQNLGFLPFFQVKDTDPDAAMPEPLKYQGSAFLAGIAVAMMVLPMICAVMREVFSQAPPGEREAALALGSTRWGMVRSVVLPFGRGGIIGGTMLGLGRALGETIAVVLIINQAEILKPRVIETGTNTISALIATKFSDASEAQLSALLSAGLVLFIITLIINTLASIAVSRSRSGADADA